RVFDFGLARPAKLRDIENSARATQSAVDGAALPSGAVLGAPGTEAGKVLGTPDSMSPERQMGEEGDETADQDSVGAALWQEVYAELPLKGQSIGTRVRNVRQGKASWTVSSQVPSGLRRAVLRGLRPDRADRYPSMDALLDELVLQAISKRRRFLA